jgi:hypothetical protein
MEKIMNTLRERIERKEFNKKILRIPQEQEEYLRPGVKKKDRQINMTRPINPTRALIVTVKIRDTRARILIDSGYLGNFIFSNFVKKV